MSTKLSQDEILHKIQIGEITIEKAKEELNKLGKLTSKPVTYKVSDKGCISIYGIRKMPISLYIDEYDKIVEIHSSPEFKSFINDNIKTIKHKDIR